VVSRSHAQIVCFEADIRDRQKRLSVNSARAPGIMETPIHAATQQVPLALFNLAIDSKLRSCDLVTVRVRDVCHRNVVAGRAIVIRTVRQLSIELDDAARCI
jgi:hypothetical protein